MKPVFIINRLSETVAKKGSQLARLKDQASAVFEDHIFDDLDHIVAAGQEAGWVIIEGGDGTAQGILSAFLTHAKTPLPKFTLLPGGMTNQVSKNIGLKKLSATSVAALLGGHQETVQSHLLEVSCDEFPSQYGFLFSTGGVPMITEYTKSKLHSKGIGGSAAVVGGILRGISGRSDDVLYPTDIALEIDGKMQLQSPHLGTLVTTLPSLLLGLDPFWGGGGKPLRVTAVSENAKKLPVHVAGLWMGRKQTNRAADGLHSWTANRLDYVYDGPIVLDGEALTLSRAFQVTPTQAVTFIK